MQPAVQGAIIGACAAILGVLATGIIQWLLKISEESRRTQEVAEIVIYYNRRLRRAFQDFSNPTTLSNNLALGISINEDDIADLEYVLNELSTKIPPLTLILFDVRRHLKNIQTYTAQYQDLINEIKEGCNKVKDLPIILGWINIDAKNGSIESHKAIQLAFSLLSKHRRKKILLSISSDKNYNARI